MPVEPFGAKRRVQRRYAFESGTTHDVLQSLLIVIDLVIGIRVETALTRHADYKMSAGDQHAVDLPQQCVWTRDVLQHVVHDRTVETGRAERQAVGVHWLCVSGAADAPRP